MLESGLSGSVRGVPSNGHPYRDPRSKAAANFRDRGGGHARPPTTASSSWSEMFGPFRTSAG
jgi:hypothetical protein